MLLPQRKADLKSLRENLLKCHQVLKKVDPVILDNQVDSFIDWYFKHMVKGFYTETGEYNQPIEMRNFIEKMAVWYELRYPDYEINRLLPCTNQERTKVDAVMFQQNHYIDQNFSENDTVRILDWKDFYNTEAFIASLPVEERCWLQKPKYRSLVYVDPDCRGAHLYLTDDGIVIGAEHFDFYTYNQIKDSDLDGIHVKDVIQFLKEKEFELPNNNELEQTIQGVEKQNYQREELLNCVMYRIIERGGNRMGPRRGFLFAKEFGRNINIPLIYGIDESDPGLRIFINEYLKAGGTTELICYSNYFSRKSKHEKVHTVSIKDLLQEKYPRYTEEEKELQQRLAQVLDNQINPEKLKKEKVKQLRIQRKLEKSRKNSKLS